MRCMRESRTQADKKAATINPSNSSQERQVDSQEKRPLGELRSSQEAGPAPKPSELEATGQRAINLVMCKVCGEREVKRMTIPCGHLVMCTSCLTRTLRSYGYLTIPCPICREGIKDHFDVIMIE
ncbi:baculoviral IAP repeat-containing 7 isoform X1 [Olea europaea subsp. europaea]|uniref:Baculoviral IAP repeat-containing 7 isoform X1 n=1 Tax=Olea europaea subsp. europaea TaxID=158383 RepID=A0A8S0SF36_OLEEU|nr:baculoviral IAP repeat-containing 7 isoform X1 [Olea europaea subsp. europaea]